MTMRVYGVKRRPGTTNKDRAAFVVTNEEAESVAYEKASRYIYTAVELWGLVDPQHSEELLRFMKEEVEAYRDDGGEYILNPAEVKQLVALVQGLDTALLQITDRYWHLRPEHVDAVRRQVPDLVTTWQQPDGTMIYSIANALMEVLGVLDYMQEAARLGLSVNVY